MPELSVLICTRNRAARLEGTLNSLSAAEPACEWEVVVVDNGSSDDTAEVLRSFSSRLPLKVVMEDRAGLSRARNAALATARGQYFLMTDDDCLVARDWLKVATRLLRDEPLRLIGGRVELHDPEDLPLAIKTSMHPQQLNGVDGVWGFLHGANLALGRGVTDRIGGFDVRLGAGSILRSAEDTDFMYRAWRAGIPVHYEPAMAVHHHHGRRGADAWYTEVAQHALGFGAMAMKHAVAGDRALFRALYWDMRSTLRRRREEGSDWRRVLARLQALRGMRQYWAVRNAPPS